MIKLNADAHITDPELHVLPRKLCMSIDRNFRYVVEGTFEEQHIKELFLDVREALKYGKRQLEKINDELARQLISNMKPAIEVANCIAHEHRQNKGLIDIAIRNHLAKIEKCLDDKSDVHAIKVSPAFHTNEAISGLIIALQFATQPPFNMPASVLDCFKEQHYEIGLCILSLMQDIRFTLQEESGTAYLYVNDHEGELRLNCRVIGSHLVPRLDELEPSPQLTGSLDFPVVASNIKNKDKLLFVDDDHEPPLLDTYRSDKGDLVANIVNGIRLFDYH